MDAASAGFPPAGTVWAAVIAAAGSSARMKGGDGGGKKEYRFLPGRFDPEGKPLTVLGAAVSAFAALDEIKTIVIAVPLPPETGELAARAALPSCFLGDSRDRPRLLFVPGGKNRRASVHHALSLLEAYHPAYTLIHDGARPWVSVELIRRVMAAALHCGAAVPLLPLVETPKEIVPGAPGTPEIPGLFFIRRHLRRAAVGTAQTPQAFRFPEILSAHRQAADRELAEGFEYTDDAEVWGESQGPVAAVPGAPENRKITFPEDLAEGREA
jgi:2-C-methyl-D-erythritol 4-phosphate cytidylyltransferase